MNETCFVIHILMKTNIFILNRVTNSDTNYIKMRYVPLLNDSSLRRTPR